MFIGSVPLDGVHVFYLHTKVNSKQRPLAAELYFRSQFRHVVFLRHLYMCDHTKFLPRDTQTGAANAPFINLSSSFLSEWAECRRKNTHNDRTVYTSDRESDGRF